MSLSEPSDSEEAVREAVLEDLRTALRELAGALLAGGTRTSVDEALQRALSLAGRVHGGVGSPAGVLSNLQRDLRALTVVDYSWYAQQLTLVADRL